MTWATRRSVRLAGAAAGIVGVVLFVVAQVLFVAFDPHTSYSVLSGLGACLFGVSRIIQRLEDRHLARTAEVPAAPLR